MKNADTPANPAVLSELVDGHGRRSDKTYSGLTKREMFAMAAMQGLISSHPDQAHNHNQGATVAIAWADELLKQLDL